MRTRFAPTPSGYLHVGNLVNFVLTDQLARDQHAEVVLRIDDSDSARTRPEYVNDIFDALQWLNLSWQLGPRQFQDMDAWSQESRRSHYQRARDQLIAAGATYACECSRQDWAGFSGDSCPRDCQRRAVAFIPGATTLRWNEIGHRDVAIWRREDLPSYHVASIVDDDEFGVDYVVRGADLEPSTRIQRLISKAIPGSTFHRAQVVHHPLVLGEDGKKLSKSSGSAGTPIPRTTDNKRFIANLADQLRTSLTLRPPQSYEG